MAKRLTEFDTLSPAHDARLGHGYGRTGSPSGAGTTWMEDESFPYIEVEDYDTEDLDDFWDDPIDADRFMTKLSTQYYSTHDPYGQRRAKVDRRSFAHSSNRGLGESAMPAVAAGISPFPGMYKGRGPAVGGTAPSVYKTAPGRKGGGHGSKRGWFGSPPPMLSADIEPIYTLDDILDLSDDKRALAKAKADHEELTDEYDHLLDDFNDGYDDEE